MEQRSFNEQVTGTLYLVPTPIGNLEDMTYRAVRQLREVDLILAEDTRNTVKLLNHFEIKTPMQSFHEHSQEATISTYVAQLEAGRDIALVSDAGMPLINDPGHPIVTQALAKGIAVVGLPGANAALTALIASGLSCERFTYYGFFPRTNKLQQAVLTQVGQRAETAIFYESPYRVKKALLQIAQQLQPTTQVVIARELTKRFETYLRGSVVELNAYLQDAELKGECVLLVEGGQLQAADAKVSFENTDIKQLVEAYMLCEKVSAKMAIKYIAKQYGLKKQRVYQAYHEL